MRLSNAIRLAAVSVCLAASFAIVSPLESFAQGAPNVAAVTLQVVPGPNGAESVVTPKGMVVPLPGAGVGGNSVQIYYGSQGGFWYVDRNGRTVDLTNDVQRFRAMTGGGQGMAQQAPQYAPAPPVQNNYYNSAPSGSGSGSGSSGLGTAAAAGLGAMAGAAMTNGYYNQNVPYGTPMYYPHGAAPYYMNPQGAQVAVTNNYEANANLYNQHANNFEKQQQWYQQQQTQNPQQFKQWQQNSENPFVRQDAGNFAGAGAASGMSGGIGGASGASGAAAGAAANGSESGRRGRFGRGGDGGSEGGRGRLGGDSDGQGQGGRFGGDAGQAQGRFGSAGADSEGRGQGRFGGDAGQAQGGRFGGSERGASGGMRGRRGR